MKITNSVGDVAMGTYHKRHEVATETRALYSVNANAIANADSTRPRLELAHGPLSILPMRRQGLKRSLFLDGCEQRRTGQHGADIPDVGSSAKDKHHRCSGSSVAASNA